jgi:D-alanine-D-alanine ligase-like ATP-grasp enzyme
MIQSGNAKAACGRPVRRDRQRGGGSGRGKGITPEAAPSQARPRGDPRGPEEDGPRAFYHTLDGTPESLHSLATERADLYFNLTESYDGDDTKEMHVGAISSSSGRRYTGAGPQGLYLAQDKALAKKIFAFHGIRRRTS